MRNIYKIGSGLTAALAVGLGGFGTSTAQESPPPSSPPDAPMAAELQTDCPRLMRFVEISTTPLEDGVAITFTTPKSGQLEALRRQVRYAATLLEQDSLAGNTGQSDQEQMQQEGMEQQQGQQQEQEQAQAIPSAFKLPPVDMSALDIESGIRVEVHAERSSDVSTLRQRARALQALWESSACVEGGRGNE